MFSKFMQRLRLTKNVIFSPSRLDPPKKVIVIGSTGSGRARRFLTKPLEDAYREYKEKIDNVCEKIAKDLSDTIETEW